MFWIATLLISSAVEGTPTLRDTKCNVGEFLTPECSCGGGSGYSHCYNQQCCDTCPTPLAAGKAWMEYEGAYPTIPTHGGTIPNHWIFVMQSLFCVQHSDKGPLPSCLIGNAAYAQIGAQSTNPITGATETSDGCCIEQYIVGTTHSWCQSTGDPHLVQFDQGTGDAYINGDYWLYKGEKLQLAVRHVKDSWGTATRAGNNAFYLAGELMGDHTLEYYDLDTKTRQSYQGRTEAKIYIDGQPILPGNGNTAEQNACKFFMDRNQVCACEWVETSPGKMSLTMRINDKTSLQVDRWDSNRGWNNIFLNVDNNDKDATDIGMCTYTGSRTDPHGTPYSSDRMDCAHDVFTDVSGKNDAGTPLDNYFCLPETQQRRRWAEEKRRRSEVDDMNACKEHDPEFFQQAYQMCSACSALGQQRLLICITDACFSQDLEGAQGEVHGCVQQIVAFTPPEKRAQICPGTSSYNPSLQSCVDEFKERPGAQCGVPAGLQTFPATILTDCRVKCSHDLSCGAYEFDAYTHTCKTMNACYSWNKGGGQKALYYKLAPTVAPRGGTPRSACTADVQKCPDGSFVSRIPPSCVFEPCSDQGTVQVCEAIQDYDYCGQRLDCMKGVANMCPAGLRCCTVPSRGSGLQLPAVPMGNSPLNTYSQQVDTIHNNVEGLEDDLDDHIDDVHSNIDDVKGDIDGVRDEVRTLSATMEQLLRQITANDGARGSTEHTFSAQPNPALGTYATQGMQGQAAPAPPAPAASPKSDDAIWKSLTIASTVLLLGLLCCCGLGAVIFMFTRK